MRPIIHIEKLSKQYRLGKRGGYSTFRDELVNLLRRPFEKQEPGVTLWALRDVSFDIYPGEVVGIIGRNGAGKSTLLKILSRITEPSSGRADLYGRVGSLLEVGTGFHSELTGRENIYLNGAILGMRKAEIDRKFDEIAAFAEVDAFLDTPVKRYSSGMHTKLAFSVAAHLDPEILVVDEVLAVGDAAFQKKCLAKMRDVAYGGRTVLFVSHNSATIEALCSRCIWLRDGGVKGDGSPEDMLRQYLTYDATPEAAQVSLEQHGGRVPGSERIMAHAEIRTADGRLTTSVRMGESLGVRVQFSRKGRQFKPILGVALKTLTGAPLCGINNRFIEAPAMPISAESGIATCWVDKLPLMPGSYFIDLHFGDEYRDLDVIREALQFDVEASDVFGTGRLCPAGGGPFAWGARYEYEAIGDFVISGEK